MKPCLKYTRSFLLGMQNAMEYRVDFLLSMVSAVWPIFIQFFLWTGIYGGAGSQSLFGYTYAQMIAYTVFANIVQRLTRTGFEYEMNEDIKNGGLDKFIVRPIGYFPYRMAVFLGGRLLQAAVLLLFLFGGVAAANAVLGTVVQTAHALQFLPALALAFALNFTVFFCVGMLAFTLTEIGFLYEAVRIVFIAMSGGIFPLDVFGREAAAVLGYLPFKYIVNFPVDVLSGRLAGPDVLAGCLTQALWIALLSGLGALLWKRGIRKYIAAGG